MSVDLFFNLEEVSSLLKQEKYFIIVDDGYRIINDHVFALCLHVQDEDKNEYSLFINHNSNQKDLHSAKIKVKYLKSIHHPNIISYVDDFTIGDYYFLQTERVHTTLLDWISQKISKETMNETKFIDIAMQLCDVTFYLNKNKCFLDLQSTLQCFTIDNDMKIKLIHFVTAQDINITHVKSIFEQCREKNELFYYKKDILTMDNKNKLYHVHEIDQWAVGICLYYLSGASIEHLLNFIEGKECYQFSEILGLQSNLLLFSMNFTSPSLKNRPSLLRLLGSLQGQQKKLQQQLQLISEDITDIVENREQIKQDFEIFVGILKSIINEKNNDLKKLEIIQQMIEKYGPSDTLLQQQAVLLLKNDNKEEALKRSEEMVKINPFCDTAYINLGIINAMKGKWEESIRYLEQPIEINPLQDNCYYYLGRLFQRNKPEDGFQYYKLSTEANPNNFRTYLSSGLYYVNKVYFLKGIQYFKKAFEIKKIDANILHQLGSNYSSIFQYEKALTFMKLSLEIKDNATTRDLISSYKKKI